jgi:hypothetical protein
LDERDGTKERLRASLRRNAMLPAATLGVDASKVPFSGWEEGELEEEGIGEFDVPLGLLPAVLPPGAGEGEGAAGSTDLALVGAGEESEGVLVMALFFGGDVDLDGRALALEGEEADGRYFGDKRGFEIGRDGGEGDGIGAMGVEVVRDAEVAGADDGGEAAEGVGEFVGVFEAA